MLGTDFNGSYFNNIQFDNCILDLANLNQLTCKVVNFGSSSLKDVSFSDNKLSKVIFYNCDLNEMIVMNTKLKGIDWSNCRFETIEVDQNYLRGLKLNREQAAFFAQNFLGVKI